MCEAFVGLFFVLGVVTVIGHLIWIFFAWLGRSLFGAERDRDQSADHRKAAVWCSTCLIQLKPTDPCCPKCGAIPPALRRRQADDLDATERQIRRFVAEGKLDEAAAVEWLSLVHSRRVELERPRTTPVAAVPAELVTGPAEQAQPTAQDLDRALSSSREAAAPARSSVPLSDDDLLSADDVAEVSLAPASPIARPESIGTSSSRRRVSALLAGFMEDRNIRWGELVSSILIVGCSMGLVISLWNELQAIPYFPAVLFMAVTAAIHGAGLYTLNRWKLKSTSRGLLTISMLLIPLNFLAAISLSVRGEMRSLTDPIFLVAVATGCVVFGLMACSAARVLARPFNDSPLWFVVLTPSIAQIVINRMVASDTAGLELTGFAAAPVLNLAIGLLFVLVEAMRWRLLTRRRVSQLLRVAGTGTFSTLAALALLIWKSGRFEPTLAWMSPVLTCAAATLLTIGLLIHRRVTQPGLAVQRTAGTAIVVLAASLMVASVVVAWPHAGLVIAVGVVNFVVLSALARISRFPSLHVPAIESLALAVVVGVHLATGTIDVAGRVLDASLSARSLLEVLLLGRSALVLSVVALLASGVAFWLKRHDGIVENAADNDALRNVAQEAEPTVEPAWQLPGAGSLERVTQIVAAANSAAHSASFDALPELTPSRSYFVGAGLLGIASAVAALVSVVATVGTLDADLATIVLLLDALLCLGVAAVTRISSAVWIGSVFLLISFWHGLTENSAILALYESLGYRPTRPVMTTFLLHATVLAGFAFVLKRSAGERLAGRNKQAGRSTLRAVPTSTAEFQSELLSTPEASEAFASAECPVVRAATRCAMLASLAVIPWLLLISPGFGLPVGLSALSAFAVNAGFSLWAGLIWAVLWRVRPSFRNFQIAQSFVTVAAMLLTARLCGVAPEIRDAITGSAMPLKTHLLFRSLFLPHHFAAQFLTLALVSAAGLPLRRRLTRPELRAENRITIDRISLSVACAGLVVMLWARFAVAVATQLEFSFATIGHGLLSPLQIVIVLTTVAVLLTRRERTMSAGWPDNLSGASPLASASLWIWLRFSLTGAVVFACGMAAGTLGSSSWGTAAPPGLVEWLALIGTLLALGLAARPVGCRAGLTEESEVESGHAAEQILQRLDGASPIIASGIWLTAATLPALAVLTLNVSKPAESVALSLAGVLALFSAAPLIRSGKTGDVLMSGGESGASSNDNTPTLFERAFDFAAGALERLSGSHSTREFATTFLGAPALGLSVVAGLTCAAAFRVNWLSTRLVAFGTDDGMPLAIAAAGPLLLLLAASVIDAVRQSRTRLMLTGSFLVLQIVGLISLPPLARSVKSELALPFAYLQVLGLAAALWLGLWMLLTQFVRLLPIDEPADAQHAPSDRLSLNVRIPAIWWQTVLAQGLTWLPALWLTLLIVFRPEDRYASGTGMLAGLGLVTASGLGAMTLWQKPRCELAGLLPGFVVTGLATGTFLAGLFYDTTSNATASELWRPFHVLSASWLLIVVAAGVLPGLLPRWAGIQKLGISDPGPLAESACRWASIIVALLAVIAGRSLLNDPFAPHWTTLLLSGAALSLGLLGVFRSSASHALLSSVALVAAGSVQWLRAGFATDRPGLLQSRILDAQSGTELAVAIVFWLAVAALLWLRLGRGGRIPNLNTPNRGTDSRGWPVHCVLATAAQCLGLLIAFVSLLSPETTLVTTPVTAELFSLSVLRQFSWLALATLGALLTGQLREARSRGAIPSLFVFPLLVALVAIDGQHRDWQFAVLSLVVGTQTLITGLLLRYRSNWFPVLRRFGFENADPELQQLPRWFSPVLRLATALTVVIALSLAVSGVSESVRLLPSLAALLSAAGLALHAGPLGDGRFRLEALLIGTVAAVSGLWGLMEPNGLSEQWLTRSIRALEAVSLATFLFSIPVARFVKDGSDWKKSLHSAGAMTGVTAIVALLIVLALEAVFFAPGAGAPVTGTQIAVVAAALVALSAGLIAIAVMPGRDPLALTDRGRRAYVYAAEAVAALLFLHIYLTLPELFTGRIRPWWPLIVMAIAFAGAGVGEVLRRSKIDVLADPLQRTATFLPLLPALGFWLVTPRTQLAAAYSTELFAAGLVYVFLLMWKRTPLLTALAAAAGNAGLWAMWHETGISLLNRPQVWMIPPALSVLVASHLNRRRLSTTQLTALRYASTIVVYVASSGEMFINGVAESLWLPMILATLSIVGVLAGIMLHIRPFLYLGSSFLWLSVVSMVWHAAARIEHVWPWWVFGIAMGIAILTLFGLFEKRRNEMRRLMTQLREWE